MSPPDNERRPAGKRSAERTPTKAFTEILTELVDAAAASINDLIKDAAQLAIETNTVVILAAIDIAVVPDLVILGVAANGLEMTPTYIVERADGRSAWLYRWAAEGEL